ncbi:hypothetical protein [Cohnella nanjingensis]|uniref:HK97 gp10 family phage protein n=1 Tax=Cohnella nanjingensis TaxID=1387779 RepID=A0A7X0VGD6_9BACL|nr:hypothetical protein [Cohnella nanjingensis]MBB6673015.1 hypothetical protein [Cohnella nanjingensis]
MGLADQFQQKIERRQAATLALGQHWAKRMESEAKQKASWRDRTGHARQGIHGGVEKRRDVIVLYLAHSMRYGQWLETGSAPHVIRAKTKRGLFWGATRANGKPLIVKKVNHPGTKARPIIRPTMERNLKGLRADLRKIWSDGK